MCRRTVANTRGRKTLIIGISRCRLIGLLSFSLWSHVVAWVDWVGVEHDAQCSELVAIYTVIGVVTWFFVDNYRVQTQTKVSVIAGLEGGQNQRNVKSAV